MYNWKEKFIHSLDEMADRAGSFEYVKSAVTHSEKTTFLFQRKKILIAVCVIILLLSTTVAAFSGKFIFVPGWGPVSTDKSNITHSISGITEIEKDGYTHKIIYGYIEKKRVNIELFFYKTSEDINFNQQFYDSDDNSLINSRVDYSIYYDGKECKNYTKLYGTSVSISYELPTIKKNDTMTIALYADGNWLTDIPFYTMKSLAESQSAIPYSENQGIILTANANKKEDFIEIYISALLPTESYREMPFFGDHNRRFGFEESDVLLRDESGTIYLCKSSVSNPNRWDDMESVDAQKWHFYRFEIPEGINQFTIIVPDIVYATGNSESWHKKTVSGPWEIYVSLNN